MKKIVWLFIVSLIISCGDPNLDSDQEKIAVDSKAFKETVKYQEGDPFIETIKKSEFFKVSGLEDKVIETDKGTIISIPKGAFRDKQGNIVEKEVTVEIADISSFEEQFNSNINSPAGQNILLDGGALYINATKDGEQLMLNEDSPIYIESLQESSPNSLVFEGIRNDKGEMQWINPKQAKKYLVPVDLSELNFLPEGFAAEVEKNMPFGNYKETTKELIDSLYYSLNNMPLNTEAGIANMEVNELIGTINRNFSNYEAEVEDVQSAKSPWCKAIKPASIKVIKSKKFENTFIATKQFEERLQFIHKTRKQKALEIYTSNLSIDLSKCDSLVADLFEFGSSNEIKFRSFSMENYSNIENLPRSVEKLGKYYSTKLKQVEKELMASKRKHEEALLKKSEEAQEVLQDYKKLLVKRQNYRMNRHGFELTNMGWVAKGRIILEYFTIDLKVKEGNNFDRVHVYTIDPTINSIFAWQSIDKINFNYAYPQDNILVYKKGIQAKALVVAYKENEPYYDQQEFIVKKEIDVNFSLQATTEKNLNRLIKDFDSGSRNFNKINADLEYQAFLYAEKNRLKKLKSINKALTQFYNFVYKCGVDSISEDSISFE